MAVNTTPGGGGPPPTYYKGEQEMVQRVNIDLDKELWRQVGIKAAEESITKRELTEKALKNYLKGEEVPMTYKIKPADRMDLTVPDPFARNRAQTPWLAIDISGEEPELSLMTTTSSEGLPVQTLDGTLIMVQLLNGINADDLTYAINNGELDAGLTAVITAEGWERSKAIDDLGEYLAAIDRDCAIMEASEWLTDDDTKPITADTTQDELETLAEDLTAAALEDNVILVNVLWFLEEHQADLSNS